MIEIHCVVCGAITVTKNTESGLYLVCPACQSFEKIEKEIK